MHYNRRIVKQDNKLCHEGDKNIKYYIVLVSKINQYAINHFFSGIVLLTLTYVYHNKFEDWSRKSTDRQYNGHRKKRTNLQNTTQKTTARTAQTPLIIRGIKNDRKMAMSDNYHIFYQSETKSTSHLQDLSGLIS